MNGPHDMGGMQCYGPVEPEADEPVFHGEWEKRALAITVAMGGTGMWNLDQSRFARESLPPVQYLSSSYYQIWLAGLESLMKARGMVTGSELDGGRLDIPPVETKRPAADRAVMKTILATTAVTALLAASAASAEGELNIYNWGNYTSPEMIEKISKRFNVPKNYMFIGTPGDRFPHNIADLGGVRVIL